MNFSEKFFFYFRMAFVIMYCNTLTHVSAANDSRITVIILEDDGEGIIHSETTTKILNAKILKMGFKPVIDANHAIKLYDAQLLENVYKGYPEEFIRSLDSVTDYLVIGRLAQSENNLDFYDYYDGRTIESPLKSVKVNLRVDVIIYDTGEIIGTFLTHGVGFGSNNSQASEEAIEIAANEAAIKLEEAFKDFGKQTSSQYLFTIIADDYEKLDQILKDIRSVDSVNFVQIREQRGKIMTLSVESYQPPAMIVQLLKERTGLNFYVERLSANSCTLRFSDKEASTNDEENFVDIDDSGFDVDREF